MNAISKISYRFSLLFKVLLVLYPLSIMAVWLGIIQVSKNATGFSIEHFPHVPRVLDLMPGVFDLNSIRLTLRLCAGLVDMIPTAAVMFSFYYLVKLFELYSKNIIFSYQNVQYIRKIGFALLFQVITTILIQPILSLILTFDAPKGGHIVTVSLGADSISNLMIAGIVILISWIMEEGRKLEEEKALTV